MTMAHETRAHRHADPDDIGAQIDLIGLPWLMIGADPSSAPNGGSRAVRQSHSVPLIRPAQAGQADAQLGAV
jgi:hypothetical protein